MTSEPKKLPDLTLVKRIRFLRTQAQLTQDDLAGKLNITRQALSNWERDINLPDLDLLEKICTIFGVHMDELMRGAMNMELNMEMIVPQEIPAQISGQDKTAKGRFLFNKYDLAIGVFYLIGLVLGTGIFFVGGFASMATDNWEMGWGLFLFAGICAGLAFGLLAHAIITLTRKDR